MNSGPYQSKVFQFVIGQYRQGMERHRRGVRGARSTASLALGIGAAVTVLPVYAVVHASQVAGRKLRQAVANRRLLRIGAKVADLLDFSAFDELPALETGAEEDLVLEKPAAALATQAMARTLLAVGACLSPRQVTLLSEMKAGALARQLGDASAGVTSKKVSTISDVSTGLSTISAKVSVLWERLTGVRQRSMGRLARPSPASLGTPEIAENQVVKRETRPAVVGRITGVASDLETRSLVLIMGHTVVWQGLSAVQQTQLQAKIELFLQRDYPLQREERVWMQRAQGALLALGRTLGNGEALVSVKQNLSTKVLSDEGDGALAGTSQLMRPIRTLWIEVLRLMNWLYRQHGVDTVETLPSGLNRLTGIEVVERDLAPDAVIARIEASKTNVSEPAVSETQVSGMSLMGTVARILPPSMVGRIVPLVAVTAVVSTAVSRVLSPAQPAAAQSALGMRSEAVKANELNAERVHCLDADVIAVDYIEHPLEKLLKWVDRLLLWVEAQWQRMADWLAAR